MTSDGFINGWPPEAAENVLKIRNMSAWTDQPELIMLAQYVVLERLRMLIQVMNQVIMQIALRWSVGRLVVGKGIGLRLFFPF